MGNCATISQEDLPDRTVLPNTATKGIRVVINQDGSVQPLDNEASQAPQQELPVGFMMDLGWIMFCGLMDQIYEGLEKLELYREECLHLKELSGGRRTGGGTQETLDRIDKLIRDMVVMEIMSKRLKYKQRGWRFLVDPEAKRPEWLIGLPEFAKWEKRFPGPYVFADILPSNQKEFKNVVDPVFQLSEN